MHMGLKVHFGFPILFLILTCWVMRTKVAPDGDKKNHHSVSFITDRIRLSYFKEQVSFFKQWLDWIKGS
jgi:hypothetical protein